MIYYYAPDAVQEWIWITPGSLFATTLWLVISLVFKFYVAHFTSYNATYGAIGGVIVLMLWFYLSALAVLVGAELNAEIEHASPYGKDPGEKVAGEKKLIGAVAERAWIEQKACRHLQAGDCRGQLRPRHFLPPARPAVPPVPAPPRLSDWILSRPRPRGGGAGRLRQAPIAVQQNHVIDVPHVRRRSSIRMSAWWWKSSSGSCSSIRRSCSSRATSPGACRARSCWRSRRRRPSRCSRC